MYVVLKYDIKSPSETNVESMCKCSLFIFANSTLLSRQFKVKCYVDSILIQPILPAGKNLHGHMDCVCKISANKAMKMWFEVPNDELLKRAIKRAEIEGREDDKDPAVIQKRFDIYESETKPIIDFAESNNFTVHKIDGIGSIEEVFSRISQKLG